MQSSPKLQKVETVDLAEFERRGDKLYAEMDALDERRKELADEFDEITFQCHIAGGNRIHDMAAIWNLVPKVFYNRLARYRAKHGDERDNVTPIMPD